MTVAQKSKSSNRFQRQFCDQYGPWAVVTGASSGIGREFALKLAEAGLNLVLVARTKQALEQLAHSLTQTFGVEVRVVSADLALKASLEAVEKLTENLEVGLLVAAAGFGTSGSFLDTSLEDELEMLDVNCRAVLAMSLHFGQRFAQQQRGGIILMSSIVGFQGTPYASHYAATKAYIQALAEGLYVELAPFGVDILASAPGPTNSGFANRAGMQMSMALQPQEIAQATLNALGKKATVLPGFLSKLLTYSLIPLPRSMRVQIMGRVMHSMTNHR